MINNRQNGRRRGRGGQQVRSGQPGNQDRGNRIDNRARGNAAQLLEKYKSMAQEAQRQGDRVNTEYYLQFADHYFRVLSESRARFDEQRPNDQRQPRQDYRDDFGQDGDDEGDGQRFEQDGNWGDDDDRQAPQQRQPERQADRPMDRPIDRQADRQPDRQVDRQPDRAAERRPLQPRYAEPAAQPTQGTNDAEEDQPREPFEGERRPRRARGPAVRANGNGQGEPAVAEPVSERIEIDRLPQSIAPPPVTAGSDAPEGEEAPRPRRRAPRRPRTEASTAEA